MSKKYLVAKKHIERKDLFVISSFIEAEETNAGNYIVKDLVYLEFYRGYDINSRVSMAINSLKLRNIYYALKELYKTGKTNYKEFTDSSLSQKNTSESEKKMVTFKLEKEQYYINLNKDGYRVVFDAYSLLSFIDMIELIANTTDEVLYKYQRAFEKSKGKN